MMVSTVRRAPMRKTTRRMDMTVSRWLLLSCSVAALAACNNGLTAGPTTQVRLAGGSYTMGSGATCRDAQGETCVGDRAPHAVQVSPFYLDVTEVTRLQYATCVTAGACLAEAAPAFDYTKQDQAVEVNDPAAARAYCAFRGLRLPTEAEFEFAARADAEGALHDYPWGDAAPSCDRVAYADCPKSGAKSVGKTPGDVSAAGIYDLAGGVPEWVDDSYVAHAGCLDRLGYEDLCGEDASCAATRCEGDDASCLRGCLPPSEDQAGVQMGSGLTSTPQCRLVADSDAALVDPVSRSQSNFGVVRGAGSLDRACDLAGYTRRHAVPGRYWAGFRCALTDTGAAQPTPPASYRFRLEGCPAQSYPVRLVVKDEAGQPVDYSLDRFPSLDLAATGAVVQTTATDGVVDDLPCSDSFVLRPRTTATFKLEVHDEPGCAAWSQTVGLAQGGDVPAQGVDRLALAGAASCELPQATGSCVGQCALSCSEGYRDCNATFVDGCEIDVRSDKQNCGACGTTCSDADFATVACIEGACALAQCEPRHADCDRVVANGCEVATDTDPNHCGGCQRACSRSHIALPTCSTGTCDGACDTGYADCNGDKLSDGCETKIATDTGNCGGCAMPCSTNHVTGTLCSAGACSGACEAGWADCNHDKRSDGCEVDTDSDAQNCGGCGIACDEGEVCQLAHCVAVP